MNLRNLEYLIQEAFIGIWRNGIMALASISTIALSMAILGAFLLLALGSHRFVERQLAKFEIMAYTPTGITQADAEKIVGRIRELEYVKLAELMSRDKEWAELKRKINTDIDLGGVANNPLPFAISVESTDPRQTGALADQIRELPGIENVTNYKGTYDRARALADLVKVLGIIATAVLCFTTLFIISNAIRLTMYARRHEIRIMQLVGATNWFIRVPLILEGMALGGLGALIAFGLISAGSVYVSGLVRENLLPMLRDLSSGLEPGQFLVGLLSGGALIGALGSLVSIRRFLKT